MQEQSEENMERAVERAKEFKNGNNEDISNSDNDDKSDITNMGTNKTEEDNKN